MRFLLPLLVFVASSLAAPAADDASRRAGLDKLSQAARADTLLALSAEDIRARRYEQALKRADEALALEPANPVALNTRGAALTELGRYEEAVKALAAAAAAEPEAFAPQFNQGEILFLQKKYPEAAEHFANLQLRFGLTPILKYKLYLCYALAGNKEQADERLAAMRFPADGPAWYFAHAVRLAQSGQTAEAKRLVSAAETIHEDEAGTYHDSLVESGLLK